LDQERKAFNEAWDTIGKTLLASQYMIALGGSSFDLDRKELKPNERANLQQQAEKTVRAYSTETAKWEAERSRLGMNLMMFSENPEKIEATWTNLSASVDDYSTCAKSYREDHEYRHVADSQTKAGCDTQLREVNKSLSNLIQLLFNTADQNHGTASFWSKVFGRSE
jgi:hypothetical protein